MHINRVDIVNFKNIAQASLEFCEGINCITGMNGMGKSNLLEAVHFLSMARPMMSMPESGLIRHGSEMMMIKGDYIMDAGDSQNVAVGITRGKGKTLKCNGKEYNRISQHIGRFPVVCVTPSDNRIVEGPGEERRRLMDMVIAQGRPDYLAALIRYNRSLESRNKMLRAGVNDALLFESVESGMAEAARIVHASRRQWIEDIADSFRSYHSKISGDAESVGIAYRSVLNDKTLAEALAEARSRDIALGFTSTGVHRDDIEMTLDRLSIRRLGSQGQLKTYTIALRLAIFEYLRKCSGFTPMLLLDDIFDRLDADRVQRIMNAVSQTESFGQIFITDTNRKHIDDIIRSLSAPSLLLKAENGAFSIPDDHHHA